DAGESAAGVLDDGVANSARPATPVEAAVRTLRVSVTVRTSRHARGREPSANQRWADPAPAPFLWPAAPRRGGSRVGGRDGRRQSRTEGKPRASARGSARLAGRMPLELERRRASARLRRAS